MKKIHKKKNNTHKRLRQKKVKHVTHVASLVFALSGIASLWLALSYTDSLSAPIQAATSRMGLVDDNSTRLLADATSSQALDIRKVFDTTPPVISNITITDITDTSAIVSWSTNEYATGLVVYGATPYLGLTTSLQRDLRLVHGFPLYNLPSNKKIYFQVTSRDHDANTATSDMMSFTTLPPVTTTEHSAASDTSVPLCQSVTTAVASAKKRGEFALALFNALHLKPLATNRRLYSDVPVTDPSFKAVTALLRAGLMQGYTTMGAARVFGAIDAITDTTKGIVIARAQKKGLCE